MWLDIFVSSECILVVLKRAVFSLGFRGGRLIFAVWKSVDIHPFLGICGVVLLAVAVIWKAWDGVNHVLKVELVFRHFQSPLHLHEPWNISRMIFTRFI